MTSKFLITVVLMVVVLVGCTLPVPIDFSVIIEGTESYVQVIPATSTFPSPDYNSPTPLYDTPASPPATLTNTPTPLPTEDFATPTPERTETPQPTNTPAPTAIPPDDQLCFAGVAIGVNLNIRADHDINSVKVGTLAPGDRVVVTSLWLTTAESSPFRQEWAKLEGRPGWIALWFSGDLYAALDDKEACWDLPAEGPGTSPYASLPFVIGPRTVPGAHGFEQAYPILEAKGYGFGVSPYHTLDYCISALSQGGECVWRPGNPDCPDRDIEPRESARRFAGYARWGALALALYDNVWVEPINECMGTPMSTRELAWWAEWMDEYITVAENEGWPPLAIPGLPPGHGDKLMFSTWQPVIERLASTGGLFSMHDYTYWSNTGLCVCDPYEACRHVLNHDYMLEQGYDIPFSITEAARGAGGEPVDEEDFECWLGKVELQEFVRHAWLWIGGPHPTWLLANLDGHYVSLAERLP